MVTERPQTMIAWTNNEVTCDWNFQILWHGVVQFIKCIQPVLDTLESIISKSLLLLDSPLLLHFPHHILLPLSLVIYSLTAHAILFNNGCL